MNLKELYALIEGDYDQAMRVLRIEKLMDKHIKKFPLNPVFGELENAGKTMDATALFEASHAIKGVCSNLGLVKLAEMASTVAEEFRPGNERKLSDGEVQDILEKMMSLYGKTVEAIKEYELSA